MTTPKTETPESTFADAFEFPDGLTHARCDKPTGALTPHRHWEMTLPFDLGRAHLDTYQTRAGVYSRVYSLKTGEVAWFRVTRTAPEPSDVR